MFTKIESSFKSNGTTCRGDLYLPNGTEKPPIVIMGHGFAAERSFGLFPFAERFLKAGVATFLFDYRTFGDSDGAPRQFVDPTRHLQDWQAAIAYIRTLSQIDSSRIALWGSSFGGGHVLVSAARDQGITAVIAQVPFVDSITTIQKLGLKFMLQGTPHGLRDLGHMLMGRKPHHIKVIGHPHEFAAMNTPESYSGYSAIIPEGSNWENKCPARILFTYSLYRPLSAVGRITCPTLLMASTNDSLIAPKAVRQAAKKIPNCELIEYPIGHFDIYKGEWFETAVTAQTAFLTKVLNIEETAVT